MNNEISVKMVLMGECAVGKTSLLSRFIKNDFKESTMSTIATDFHTVIGNHEERPTRVQIWDTAGQERYRSLIPSFLNQCDGVILVFDLTSRESFLKIDDWIGLIKDRIEDNGRMLIIGNKSDLADKRKVSTEEAKAYCEKLHLFYWETSAKMNSDQNVQKAFDEIITSCLNDKIEEDNIENQQRISRLSNYKRGSIKGVKQKFEGKQKSCC